MNPLLVRHFPHIDYLPCWQAMRDFTSNRTTDTPDELWVLEHPPVFTLGQAGKPEHVIAAGDIPVVQCDRGGQVTYHGPGQTVIYLLVDIARLGMGSRALVSAIENAIVELLADCQLDAHSEPSAPGVYVQNAKIASLGLRIRRGASYHGLSLNRDMDLSPWLRINPCGHIGQPVTSLAEQGVKLDRRQTEQRLVEKLCSQLNLSAQTAPPPDWYNQTRSLHSTGQT